MQAEKWEDVLPYLKKLTDAANNMPSPPKPDDEYSAKRNVLNRTIEGLNEQVRGRVQMEQEDE